MLARWSLAVALAPLAAHAQDAERGAQLYMQLPTSRSCVSCHGPDPAAGRNNLLQAADRPLALQKALVNVGAMGFLKALLDEADVADIAAFLGRVAQTAAPEAALFAWPLTADFGSLGTGAASPPQQIQLENRSAAPISLQAPVLRGDGYSVDNNCSSVLAAGSSCRIAIRYQAGMSAALTGAMSIGNSATARPVVMALAARTLAVAGGVLSWNAQASQSVEFAAVDAGASSTSVLTLVNGGALPATLGSTTLIGPGASEFRTSGCDAGTVLTQAASCRLSIHYTPRSAGRSEAMLQLRSDASNPAALLIRGEAIAPTTAASPTPAPASDSGGGALDALTAVMLALAVLVLRATPAPARASASHNAGFNSAASHSMKVRVRDGNSRALG